MLLLATSCDSEIDQTVEGSITLDGKPASGVQISLQGKDIETCEAGLTAKTDDKGSFLLHRKAEIGNLAVIVQKDLLCIKENGNWSPVWRNTYGPAPEKMHFACNCVSGTSCNCTMNGKAGMPTSN